ncbi:MAG TPA: ABC transporter permease, partial [Cyclobacteriaceae bacterium]
STDVRIKNTCYTGWTYGHTINYQDKLFNKEGLAVSEEFLEMFDLPLVAGSASTALKDPYSIMLNESTAKEVFGDKDPIGKLIKWDNNKELRVTAVFKDVPWSSTFWFHALVPASFYEITEQWVTTTGADWNHFWYHVYVEMEPGSEVAEVNGVIQNVVKQHVKDDLNKEIFLQGMDRWYLYGDFENGREAGGKIEYVRLFTWIAIFTLLIACINYMNLSTARSERRAKEIGIRKSIGSHRSELVVQFLLESLLITIMAFVIGVVVVKLSLPSYNTLIHKRLVLDIWSTQFLVFAASLIGITTLLSGFYPAFYFSSFHPIKVLKGKIQVGKNAIIPRNVLVTIQYVFAIFLMVGMIVIYQQIQFAKNRVLGYDKENLIMIPYNDDIRNNYEYSKNELLKTGLIESITRSNQAIYQNYYDEFVEWEGKTNTDKVTFAYVSTDFDYVKTNGLKIAEGRDFSEKYATDSNAVLVNKTAVARMGYENPIGRTIKFREKEWTIIGVLDDMVMDSPFEPVDPLFVGMIGGYHQYLTMRLAKSKDLSAQIKNLETVLRRLNPSNAPEIIFADENVAYKYRAIELVGKLSNLFALLAIVLTILGVLGLAAYTAEQRTKEMAIRKILGAHLNSLLWLLSNYFIRIVIIAILIAAPVSWWALNGYLQNYSYRIAIPWWTIPLAAISMLVLTLFIVFTQVLKTASANPVKALKSE